MYSYKNRDGNNFYVKIYFIIIIDVIRSNRLHSHFRVKYSAGRHTHYTLRVRGEYNRQYKQLVGY